ncbi:MAG: hypothetical protein RBQ65_01020 [Sphaerochaeta sp.]|nr:hypothetical protein [Sphaerochaeta sp.]
MAIIAESAPFTPNGSKLSERIGINRQTFITYLSYLEEARILSLVLSDEDLAGIHDVLRVEGTLERLE